MQDALGREAIHAPLRPLTNICSGLLDCGAESLPSGSNVRAGARSFATPGDRRGCLRWCHQLTLKPRVCSRRSHRINQLGYNLMDVIASGALKRPDIEARGAWRNPRQHRCCCLASWT
jgi:hypothetical protein